MESSDPQCSACNGREPTDHCQCMALEGVRIYEYRRGYDTAIMDLSWQCGDCLNTYGPDVEYCPNKMLDSGVARRHREYGGTK